MFCFENSQLYQSLEFACPRLAAFFKAVGREVYKGLPRFFPSREVIRKKQRKTTAFSFRLSPGSDRGGCAVGSWSTSGAAGAV